MFLAALISFSCLLGVFLPSCGAFVPSNARTAASWSEGFTSASPIQQWRSHAHATFLEAVTKRQTCILDGAELSYYVKCLAQTCNDAGDACLPDVAPRARKKRDRVGAITFVTATLDEDLERDGAVWLEKKAQIIGVEAPSPSNATVSIGDELHVYRDSIALLPSKLSPSDAISTAATSLLGVHCSSLPMEDKAKRKVVIVGGGEYSTFLAKALVGLGNKVFLVSARPSWSLPSPSDVTSKNKDLVEILRPAVGSMSLGFASAIGEFDTLIDTLGDELGMGQAMTVVEHDAIHGSRFLEQLKELHGCENYLSTLTRSQQYVLKKGLLFARDPVIRYQKEVEKSTDKYHCLPPPSRFGSTLQLLLDKNIVYASSQNENGSHEAKPNFVRGWSLSDLTELKTWPREGTMRFGFPAVDLSVSSVSLRRKDLAASSNKANSNAVVKEATKESSPPEKTAALAVEEASEDYNVTEMMTVTPKANANATIIVTKRKQNVSSNPYVTTIHSASDLNGKIIEPKQHCIMFLTASYCQKCKRMAPQFNRIARMSSEKTPGVAFAHVDISSGPRGKQLGKILKADKVPSVLLFRKGDRIDVDGEDSPIVVERNTLNRLEEVATALAEGESTVHLSSLLTTETVEK